MKQKNEPFGDTKLKHQNDVLLISIPSVFKIERSGISFDLSKYSAVAFDIKNLSRYLIAIQAKFESNGADDATNS